MKSGIYFDCDQPNFCVNCGDDLSGLSNFSIDPDWKYQATFECDCGAKFIRIINDENLSKGLLCLIE